MHLKDNINSSICFHTYRGHIKRLRLKASHFPYVATHTEGTSEVNLNCIRGCTSWKLRMSLRWFGVQHQNDDRRDFGLNQGWNTNTTITFHMLPMLKYATSEWSCYKEVFWLVELSYLHYHILLSSSKGTYIRIDSSSATSKCIHDRP